MDREVLGRAARNRARTTFQFLGLSAALWLGAGGSVDANAEEATGSASSQSVRFAGAIVHPEPGEPLSARWDWAVQEASRRGFKRGVWIGYGIRRRMGAQEFIGSWSSKSRTWQSLNEVIHGERAATDPRDGELGNAKVWKTVGVLLRFSGERVEGKSLERVDTSGMEWHFELGRFTLIWLGEAEDNESIALLQKLYAATDLVRMRESLVEAVALHSEPDLVLPFLQSVLTKDEHDRVRAEAAESLGEFDDPRALQMLRAAIKDDRSRRLREEAVEAIGEMTSPEATTALEELASTGDDRRVRAEAIESLAEQAPPERAVAVFEKIIFEDTFEDLQEEAMDSMEDLPRSLTLPVLRKVAESHPSRSIRVKALEQLAETAPPAEAAALFEKVVFQDTYEELQQGAVEAMGELPQAQATSSLQKVLDKHPNEEIRDKALEMLIESLPAAEAARLLEKTAFEDPSSDLRKSAVDQLSELPAAIGLPIAKKIASSHPDSEARWEALEVILERAPAAEAIAELQRAARQDKDGDVQEEAVDGLAHVSTPEAFAALADLARTHSRSDVRSRALQSMAEQAPPAQTAALAEEIAFTDSNEEVQETALEALAELPPEFGLEGLIRVAKTHVNPDARSEAVQHLGESKDARARKLVKESEHDED